MGERLTTTEAARRVGVSVRTITRWCDDGRLPYLRLPSGQRRIDTDDLPSAGRPARRPVRTAGRDIPGLVYALADALADRSTLDVDAFGDVELAELRASIGNGTVGLTRELLDLADELGDALATRDEAATAGPMAASTLEWLDRIDERRHRAGTDGAGSNPLHSDIG